MPEQHPIRAIHLFSDKKFIGWVRQAFSETKWNSDFVIINFSSKHYFKTIDDNTIEVSSDPFGQRIILERFQNYDIAFHYFMDNVKADLIYMSHPGILHCWCFYGAEIYQQTNLFRKDLYGPATRKLLWSLPEIKFRYDLRKFYFKFFRLKQPPISSLKRAIPKIHRILWYVEEEINKINTRIQLPPWQFFQFFNFSDIIPHGTTFTNKETGRILIGNSATIENNHIDILEVLTKTRDNTYTYSLPLTYGQFPRYKEKLKTRFKKQLGDRVFFLEEHMQLDAYYDFLQHHPTAIFLHHRQQGLGNILYMLYTGTKVYLSKANVVWHWLQNHGIKVFIFEEQFIQDMEDRNLVLSQSVAEHNRKAMETLLDHNRNQDTFKTLEADILLHRQKHVT